EDLRGVEVALRRRLAAQRVGLVREADVQAVAVEVGVDGDRGDAEVAAGADDAHRDLPPVSDQDLGEHAICLRACRRAVPDRPGCRSTWSRASAPGRRSPAAGSRTCAGWPRPGRRTPTPWTWPATGPGRARSSSPTTRPRGGAA